MNHEEVRFMWLFCFFDLPVTTKPQRKAATKFRNHLKNDGFIMLQFSVYVRLCHGEEGGKKHADRIRSTLPTTGSIRCLLVTDRQFGRMKTLLGTTKKTEKKAAEQLILL